MVCEFMSGVGGVSVCRAEIEKKFNQGERILEESSVDFYVLRFFFILS